jgi:hypothetical protein
MCRRHERLFPVEFRECGLQMVDVGLRGQRIAHADRRVAGRRLSTRASRIAEHALLQVGEVCQVLVDEGVADAAESTQSILDVRRVARFAHLAVVDHVDAGLCLLANHVLDRRCDPLRQKRRFDQGHRSPGEVPALCSKPSRTRPVDKTRTGNDYIEGRAARQQLGGTLFGVTFRSPIKWNPSSPRGRPAC